MRKIDVPRFDHRAHGCGASDLTALRVDGKYSQHLNDGRAIRLVFDQFRDAARLLRRGLADSVYRRWAIHAGADLIEQEKVSACAAA